MTVVPRLLRAVGSLLVGAAGTSARRFALIVVASAGCMLFSSAPAVAALRYPFLGQVTGGATPAGAFESPNGVAVDDLTGDLLVSDSGAGTQYVAMFDSSGSFLRVASCASTTNGSNCRDRGVAVDNATGQIFMADSASGTGVPGIDVFDSTGSFVSEITGAGVPGGLGTSSGGPRVIAVDQATGEIYLYDATHKAVDVLDSSGGFVSQITSAGGTAFSSVTGLAVDDATGDLLVADAGAKSVYVLDSSHALVSTLTGSGTPQGTFSSSLFVAANDSTGDVYVAVLGSKVVDQFDSSGSFIGQIPGTPSASFTGPVGVTVDQASGHVYVVDRTVVDIFGANAVTFPDATSAAVSDAQPGSATLNGTVNPDGVQLTDCHFEYGTTIAYGQTAPCVPAAGSIPADSNAHQVSADVSGLTAGVVYHYRLVAGNANGPTDGADLLVGPPQAVSVSATPAKTTATLGAQVNPDGVDTSCEFEYVDEAGYDPSASNPYSAGQTASCSADLGNGSSAVAASATASGLTAGTVYHYRVVTGNAAGMVDGPDRKFTTAPAAQFDAVTITDVTPTSATVTAQINPLGDDTTYHFEWGTSTSYGHATPVPDADIGSGSSDVTVTAQLSGLSASTTYHVRVVATNQSGTADSGDHTFSYDEGGNGLPDDRAYELVSPPSKNGALLDQGFPILNPDVSAGGSRLVAHSIQCFAGSASCTGARQVEGQPYAFTRTAGGWRTTPLAPPVPPLGAGTDWGAIADTGAALSSEPTAPAGEDDWYVRKPDGSLGHIGPVYPPADGALGTLGDAGIFATADYSTLVYDMDGRREWPFDGTLGSGASTYEYVGTGNSQPTLVGVTGGRGSTDLISQCDTIPHAVSTDGSTVVFTATGHDLVTGCPADATAPPVSELFARIDESRTVAISEPSPNDECTTSACQSSTPEDATFVGASSDGAKAFFISNQQLTDDATQGSPNLYEYDFDDPAGHELVDLSAGDASGGGPGVQGVMAVSPDGSHVYFVATGVLTGSHNVQGQTPTPGANNLYLFTRDSSGAPGSLAFVATLSGSSDAIEWSGLSNGAKEPHGPNVTPDGRFLVFTSHADLTPDDSSVSGAAQVFRYDAQTGQLIRVSIGQGGFDDAGNAGSASLCAGQTFSCNADAGIATSIDASPGQPWNGRSDPTMSDSGAYVFFTSPAGLTPQALDYVVLGTPASGHSATYAQNVYEWEADGTGGCGQSAGCVHLISDGRDTSSFNTDIIPGSVISLISAVKLLGADASGANVFFSTADKLAPQDTDTQLDYYDARIGGGFPYTPPPAGCQGDACQGTPSAPPPVPAAASVSFTGPGSQPSQKAATARVKVTRKAVKGSRFVLSVKVPGKGRITVSGGRVKTVKRSLAKAGTYRLTLTLTKRAKQALRRTHRLKLRMRVAYVPTAGRSSTASVSMTVRGGR